MSDITASMTEHRHCVYQVRDSQLTIIEHDPEPAQTAFGVLADVLAIARHGQH